KNCNRDETVTSSSSRRERADERLAKDIDDQLKPDKPADTRDGLAAAIAIDVSGSMDEAVPGADGRKEKKIAIARPAALDLVEQFASYAKDPADESVQLGIFEFSRRRGDPDCRVVVPMGPPNPEAAAAAVAKLEADGGTPIGQAMITAKRALDDT